MAYDRKNTIPQHLSAFRENLIREEKTAAAIAKYLRDANGFLEFVEGREVTKGLTVAYKMELKERHYAVRSINSMLPSINSLMEFLGWSDCKVKTLRCQRQTYCTEEKDLTKVEYLRLLEASQKNKKLNLLIQTICGTDTRIPVPQIV